MSSYPLSTYLQTAAPADQRALFAAYADNEFDTAGTLAALVKAHGVTNMLMAGDCCYAPATYDSAVGAYWRSYIYPFTGSASLLPGEVDATMNRFWPCPGNHDIDIGNLAPYLAYFTLPNNGRYYTQSFAGGLIDVFFLDSDPREVDGNTVGSVQYNWFRRQIASSIATWKVVVFHHTSRTTGVTHGPSTWMDWGFENFGVHAVISGHEHVYERWIEDGLVYFTVGTGGATPSSFGPLNPNSIMRLVTYGFLLMTATSRTLEFIFRDSSDVVQDSYVVTNSELPASIGSMPWGAPSAPGAVLTQINFANELSDELLGYATRDRELAYRDLVITSQLSAAILYAATVFNSNGLARISLPTHIDGTVYDAPSDVLSTTYGGVSYVQPSGTPSNAPTTDCYLYFRDVMLQDVIGRVCETFPSGQTPVSPLASGWGASSLWDTAQGSPDDASVSYGVPYGSEAYAAPDRNLAARDNFIASAVALFSSALSNVFEHAQRLVVQIVGTDAREQEEYALVSDDATTRVWAAQPYIPNAIQIIYRKDQKTIQWVTELHTITHVPQLIHWGITGIATSDPFIYAGIEAGQTIQILPSYPTVHDSEWYRQKALRLQLVERTEATVLGNSVQGTSINGVTVLSAQNQSIGIIMPSLTPGSYAIYFDFIPSGSAVEYGITVQLTNNGGHESTSYTFSALPGRRDVIAFPYTVFSDAANGITLTLGAGVKSTLSMQSIQVRSRGDVAITPNASLYKNWKRGLLTRALDGIVNAYTSAMQATSVAPVFEIIQISQGATMSPIAVRTNNSNIATFSNPQLDGTLYVTGFTDATPYVVGVGIILYGIGTIPIIGTIGTVQLSDQTLIVTLTDDVTFESGYCVPQSSSPVFSGAMPLGLTLDSATGTISGTVHFLAPLGEVDVTIYGVDPTTLVVSTGIIRIRVIAPTPYAVSPFVWSVDSTERWMDVIASSGESRIRQAFRVGLPSDIGSPALMPNGLYLDANGMVASSMRSDASLPVLRAFQPWMLDVGIYVPLDAFSSKVFRSLTVPGSYGSTSIG